MGDAAMRNFMLSDGDAGGAYRSLWSWERDEYFEHLQRLDPAARRQRFHQTMSDDGVALHADHVFAAPGIHVIGWFKEGVLRGAAEVALFDTPRGQEAEAAFAVEAAWRRLGVGGGLMHRAALHARNQGAETLHIATDRDNRPMIRLAKSCGAAFEIDHTEADGVVRAAPRSLGSIALETLEEDAGVAAWAIDSVRAWAGRHWRRLRGREAA